MQKPQSNPVVETAAMAPAPTVPVQVPPSSHSAASEPSRQQSTPPTPDSYFYSRLKTQVEFYFSPQNLSRDTYLRGIMANYGGSMVPLGVIASFPKVREIAAIKTGTSSVPADPILMLKAMEGSNVAKITPDGYWISAIAPLPPLDPTASAKLRQINQQQQQAPPQGAPMIPVALHQQQPILRRQFSSGSNIIHTSSNRESSPLSHSSSNPEMTRSISRTTLIVSDIPTDFATEVVMSAFTSDTVVPKSAKPNNTNAWTVTFASEKDAQIALSVAADRTINGLPIRAKIISDKSSPTTTALNQVGVVGESDTNKQLPQQQQQHSSPTRVAGAVPPMSIQQQQQQHLPYQSVPHMGPPPQGVPNNAAGVGYPYQYNTYQQTFQYGGGGGGGGGGRYPPIYMQPPPSGPHGSAPMQYPPPMFSHGHGGYQYMQSAGARPYYAGPGPNPPVFLRSVTDPGGQMRPNPMIKTKSDISNRNQASKKNNNNNNSKNKRGQQGFYDNGGGMNQFQRVNKGSREGLDTFKGTNKNKDTTGSSQVGPTRRKTASPLLDTADSYDSRASNKGNKKISKKSKRRSESSESDRRKDQNKSEIFDENMFPALSPSKTKSTNSTSDTTAAAATKPTQNSGFNYAAALRQTNKPKPAATNNEKGESNTETIEGFEDKLKISDVETPSSESNDSEGVPTKPVKTADTVSDQRLDHPTDNTKNKSPNGVASTLSDSTSVFTNNDKVPHVIKDNSIEKTTQEIDKMSITNEPAKANEVENVPSNTITATETELNSAPAGAWGSKRSFIDVSCEYPILCLC